MKIKSTAFQHNERIPKKYTGEGEDVSPPLLIEDLPEGVATIALIVDDPDAPMGTFDHWITWNLSPAQVELKENAKVPIEGKNHFDELGYRGPMPPPGPVHRYFFKVFALDNSISLPPGATKAQLLDAMEGHILDQAELIGTYSR